MTTLSARKPNSLDGIAWERVRQITSSSSHEVQHDGRVFNEPGVRLRFTVKDRGRLYSFTVR